jgi:putative transposase
MARLPRYALPGQPQHIIQRGNNRQVIFAADADYQLFHMVDATITQRLAVHAYVWMTNHVDRKEGRTRFCARSWAVTT